MTDNIMTVVLLALSVGSLSVTITKARLFEGLRVAITSRSAFLGKLFSCPYCMSHWITFVAVGIYQPRVVQSTSLIIDLAVSVFVIVALSTMVGWLVYHAYTTMVPAIDEKDDMIESLRDALVQARDTITAQEQKIQELTE